MLDSLIRHQGTVLDSRTRPFYFVDINRTASSSIRAALEDGSEMHLHAAEARRRVEDWDDRFTFSVVRNPFSKVVSQFKHRRSFHGLTWTAEDFEQWVLTRYAEGERNTGPDRPYFERLWWPQLRWLVGNDRRLLVDHVFRFEALGHAWDEIQDALGIDRELPHRNEVTDDTPWQEFYTPVATEVVRAYFRRDFAAFRYSREI